MPIQRFFIIVLLVAGSLILAGCSSEPETPQQTPPDSVETSAEPARETETAPSETESADVTEEESVKKDETPADQPREAETASPREAAPARDVKEPAGPHPALLDPAKAGEQAPDTFQVRFTTTRGEFTVEVNRSWAPRGADRFYNLVKIGYFQDIAFFRAIEGFMVQFGIHGDPRVSSAWRSAQIQDDPVVESNTRGTITFATAGPHTRTTQFFINFRDNSPLDRQGFASFGRVIEGMEVVDSLYKGYGEGAPRGAGPNQGLIQQQGNAYLKSNFPKLDYIESARLL